jgi:hypothetical protein
MNMQYVDNSNELNTVRASDVIGTSSIQRTVSGGSAFFERPSDSLVWSVELHEQLAFDYSALSYAQVSTSFMYSRQTSLDFNAPWFTLENKLSYTFSGNPIFYGTQIITTATRVQPLTDDLTWTSAVEIISDWRQKKELSNKKINFHSGFDYRATPILSIYGAASVNLGQHISASTVQYDKSIVNEKLTDQLEGTWFSTNSFGNSVSIIGGINMPLSDELVLDLAYKLESGTILNSSYLDQTLFTSFLFRF